MQHRRLCRTGTDYLAESFSMQFFRTGLAAAVAARSAAEDALIINCGCVMPGAL